MDVVWLSQRFRDEGMLYDDGLEPGGMAGIGEAQHAPRHINPRDS